MNNIKNILFIVCISFFTIGLTSEKPQIDDDSTSESGVFESGWKNHLNALVQDKYWKKDLLALKGQKKDPLALKEQWINSAVEAAMNEKKPLDDLVKDLENKLIEVVGDKFKDQITTIGRRGQDMLVDPIVNYFAEKFKEREAKQTSANDVFLQSLKKIKTDSSGNFDLEWKKNIFVQIKDLIQLGLEEDYITNQITKAIQNYNAGLSYWYFSYKISDKKQEDIVNDIKNMKTVRDFRLRQLSTSELTQSDITKEQQSENTKVQKDFKYWLSVVGEKSSMIWPVRIIEIAPARIIEIAKDLIDIYQNPQIVIDKINKEFDRKEESLNKNKGFSLFASNEDIERIKQIKNNIMDNIMAYLRDYADLSGKRKEAKILQEQQEKEKQNEERFKQDLTKKQEVEPQLSIQKETQQQRDLYSVAKEMAQSTGNKIVDWLKAVSLLQKEREKQQMIRQNQPKKEEIVKEQTWEDIVAERRKQRELRLNPPKEEQDRIRKEREEWQAKSKKWGEEEAAKIRELNNDKYKQRILLTE